MVIDEDLERPPSGPRERSLLLRHGLSTVDALVIAAAALFSVAFLPVAAVPTWTPRVAVALAMLPAGLVALAGLVRRRDAAAVALAAALAWAAVSALFAVTPAISLKGTLGREMSVLILVGGGALWALGRSLSTPARRVLPWVMIAALLANVLVGTLQVLLEVERGTLPMLAGRPTGLTTHPVYFGALMAAGCVMAAAMTRTSRHPRWLLVAVGAFALGANLSGSRIAIIASVACVVAVAVRAPRRTAATLLLATFVGNLVAVLLNRAVGSATSAVDRLGGGAGGERFEVWRYALEAASERPITGWGVGLFRTAVQSRYSTDFTRVSAPDDRSPWFDAHNIVIELLVAVGVVGLVLFLAFAYLSGRSARGPLALGALAMVITWLVEPAALSTLPLVLLFAGAADHHDVAVVAERPITDSSPDAPRLATSRWTACALVVGMIAGSALLVADLRLKHAMEAGDAGAIEAAAQSFWRDPMAADVVAQAWAIEYVESPTPENEAAVRRWSRRTISFEPSRPGWWDKDAVRMVLVGDEDAARASLDEALRLQPGRPTTLRLLLEHARLTGDPALEASMLQQLCELQAPECDTP